MSPVQLGWKVDVNACISCRSCEMACKVEYDLKAGQGRRRRVIEKTLLEGSKVRTFFLSLACNHCEKPACIAACPKSPDSPSDVGYLPSAAMFNNALWKDTDGTVSKGVVGVVRFNNDLCIGCRRCEWACPYGAPQYNPTTERIHKCEMCWERIANTELHPSRRVGACVATCLGQAIKQDWVNTDVTATYNHTRNDTDGYVTTSVGPFSATDGLLDCSSGNYDAAGLVGGSQLYTAGQADFVAPGTAGRGSAFVADANMTLPALKIRNRVYVKRDGSGVE